MEAGVRERVDEGNLGARGKSSKQGARGLSEDKGVDFAPLRKRKKVAGDHCFGAGRAGVRDSLSKDKPRSRKSVSNENALLKKLKMTTGHNKSQKNSLGSA